MSAKGNTSGKQKDAEDDVEGYKKDLGPFVVAAETTRMPMMFTNAKASNSPIIFINQAFLNLTRYEEHEILGQPFESMIESGADPEALAELQTAFNGGRDLETSVPYRRKDGIGLSVTVFISPVRDEDGDVVQHFASFVDVTQHNEDKERARALVVELKKSKQTTIATVLAIAKQTFSDELDNKTIDHFLERIVSFSKEP